VPKLDDELRQAVALARAGDWRRAHEIVQEHDGDPIAGWIHAVVHRMEGDLDNARYWYRQSGRASGERLSFDAELAQIQAVLEDTRRTLAD
jgi:hypothetical protein